MLSSWLVLVSDLKECFMCVPRASISVYNINFYISLIPLVVSHSNKYP